MGKIFVTANRLSDNLWYGYAICENGYIIESHISSDLDFVKSDLGITTKNCHKVYSEYYPKGFEVIWVDPDKVESTEELKDFKRVLSLFRVIND